MCDTSEVPSVPPYHQKFIKAILIKSYKNPLIHWHVNIEYRIYLLSDCTSNELSNFVDQPLLGHPCSGSSSIFQTQTEDNFSSKAYPP